MIDFKEILKRIPHRYPFLLVDRILEMEPGRRIVGIKNVTANENFFRGHFPSKPVMPGVLICEAMAQVAAVLADTSESETGNGKLFMLAGLERMRFRRTVEPGDQLRMELTLLKRKGTLWKLSGVATVDGKVVADGVISAVEVPFE
jgi:beta-hydroxyacyl-ACP dehydratase FabZ